MAFLLLSLLTFDRSNLNAVIISPHVSISNLVRPANRGHQPAPGGHGSPQECLCLVLVANNPGIMGVAKVQVCFVMLVDKDNIPKVASLYETVPAHHFLQESIIGGKNVVRIVPRT